MENDILVKLNEETTVSISSDSPDLSELVRKLIQIKELNIDKIVVESVSSNFDKDSFEQAIKEAVKEIREELILNKESYEKAIKQLHDLQ